MANAATASAAWLGTKNNPRTCTLLRCALKRLAAPRERYVVMPNRIVSRQATNKNPAGAGFSSMLHEVESGCLLLPAAGDETQHAKSGEQHGVGFGFGNAVHRRGRDDGAVTHLEVVLAENVGIQ